MIILFNKNPYIKGKINFCIKASIMVENQIYNAGSKSLLGNKINYNSDIYNNLSKDPNFNYIGQANLDAFNQGSMGNDSGYENPKTKDGLYFGGSSSGCAASVYYGFSDIGIGTDTGGSIRYPALIINKFGYKPTYGQISRDGVYEYAPSLDTIGIISNNYKNLKKTFHNLRGKSSNDMVTYMKFKEKKLNKKVCIIGDVEESILKKISKENYEIIKKNNIEELFNLSKELISCAYVAITSVEWLSCSLRYDGFKFGNIPLFKLILIKSETHYQAVKDFRTNTFENTPKERSYIGEKLINSNENLHIKAYNIRRILANKYLSLEYDFILIDMKGIDKRDIKLEDESLFFIANFAAAPSMFVPYDINKKINDDSSGTLVNGIPGNDDKLFEFVEKCF